MTEMMKNKKILNTVYKSIAVAIPGVLLVLQTSCGGQEKLTAAYDVVPLPQKMELAGGTPFTMDKGCAIVCDTSNAGLVRTAAFLSSYLEKWTKHEVAVTGTLSDDASILLAVDGEGEPESYRLQVTDKHIRVTGADEAGVFYGMQTLCKSIPATDGLSKVSFPQVRIEDAPRFPYRGMMLDVCRHFYSIDFVKKYIDLLALHNINYFHWHLTDDQGWRIEIKKYPELTEVGSRRKQTIMGMSDDRFDGTPHGGFYTQEQIREVVEYAAERFITVVPEIDVPGHTLSVLASYPELGCTGGPYEVCDRWGVFEDVLCAGNEEVYTFLEGVLDEVVALFPSPYVHIGGDECPKTRWQSCPKCRARMAQLGLKTDAESPAEEKLQGYFMTRIEKYLNGKGKRIIGWDEMLKGGVSPTATVMSWQGVKGGITAARRHHDVIMAPNTHLYLDYFQSTETDSLPYAFPGYNPIERIYHFNPVPDELAAEEKEFIKGVQANLWTEFIADSCQVERMVLPRMGALAEIQWTKAEGKDYQAFLERLYRLCRLYGKLGYQYSTTPFDLRAQFETDTLQGRLNLCLSVFDSIPVYYTLDGTMPTGKSNRYTAPLCLDSSVTVKAVGIGNGRRTELYVKSLHFNKATLKPVRLLSPALPHFASDPQGSALTDGRRGNKILYGGDTWTGFYGKMSAIIDLKEEMEISEVTAGILLVPYRGEIDYQISSSTDGETFTPLYDGQLSVAEYGNISAGFVPAKARYVRVDVEKRSAGAVICDEIVIR